MKIISAFFMAKSQYYVNRKVGKYMRNLKENKKIEKVNMKVKNIKRGVIICSYLFIVIAMLPISIFATDNATEPLKVINNLSTFIFGIIRAIGMILLGWGIVQIGLALKSHDPSQRANGFLTFAGGVIVTFAKEILSLITGG